MNFRKKIAKLFSVKEKKSVILLYHHIGSPDFDPWEMFVSLKNFKTHLQVLQEKYSVQPLSGFKKNNISGKTAYISFDDGYLNNFISAYSLLKASNTPATFFIPTKNFSFNQYYWWEIVEEIFLGDAETPSVLEFECSDIKYKWHFDEIKDANANKNFSAWTDKPSNCYQQAYMEISTILKHLHPLEQQRITDVLINWFGKKPTFFGMEKISSEQLRQIASENIVEIGSHSVNHPALSALNKTERMNELTESKTVLESIIGKEILSFAYPHGDYDLETKMAVKQAGYAFACTADENNFSALHDNFALPRVWIKNWDKQKFEEELAKFFV